MSKVVLAFSGGLDTSACAHLLKQHYGFDQVIAVTLDVGQSPEDLEKAKLRGAQLADQHLIMDARSEFVRDYIFPAIKANGLYGDYPLGCALARGLIARKVAQVALHQKADAVAHGSTGKGNDQLRFDAIFRSYGLRVIAPIRELKLTRAQSAQLLRELGIQFELDRYSIDENLWTRSISGAELEDPANPISPQVFRWSCDPAHSRSPEQISIEFQAGVPVGMNGQLMDGLELISELNRIAGQHGIGRIDQVEDRVIGIKSREIYEAPAAQLLIAAHRDLERLVLTRAALRLKQILEGYWAELVYQGLIMDPAFKALNAFMDSTQEYVTGKVEILLDRGYFRILSRSSPYGLHSKELASFDVELENYGEGFSWLHSLQSRLAAQRR